MKVREWMSPDPVTVTPRTTVSVARQLLSTYGFRHLPVVDGDRLVGIISDRDVRLDDAQVRGALRRGVLGEVLEDDRPTEAVMSSSPHVIGPDEMVEAAARLMLSRRISGLPVVDADHRLCGIITTTDCLLASLAEQAQVTEWMLDQLQPSP